MVHIDLQQQRISKQHLIMLYAGSNYAAVPNWVWLPIIILIVVGDSGADTAETVGAY